MKIEYYELVDATNPLRNCVRVSVADNSEPLVSIIDTKPVVHPDITTWLKDNVPGRDYRVSAWFSYIDVMFRSADDAMMFRLYMTVVDLR